MKIKNSQSYLITLNVFVTTLIRLAALTDVEELELKQELIYFAKIFEGCHSGHTDRKDHVYCMVGLLKCFGEGPHRVAYHKRQAPRLPTKRF